MQAVFFVCAENDDGARLTAVAGLRGIGRPAEFMFGNDDGAMMRFITYHNVANPHVTVHVDGCGQVRKHGGDHAHGNGWYEQHDTYAMARARADESSLPVRDCSFCRPGLNPAPRSSNDDRDACVSPRQRDQAEQTVAAFDSHRERLLQALDTAHDAYYRSEVFGGPSLYFHHRALQAGKQGDFDHFAEYVYALLAAWGMHRMGRGGSKMREFDEFQASLRALWPTILRLRQASPDDLERQDGWRDLNRVFVGIRCMASGTSLVGNSKVMAHALPNLVPPVDREYTLTFLFGHGQIINGLDSEWQKLESILRGFFYPVLQSEPFTFKAAQWLQQPERFRWDTSPLKVVDNLIIGFLRRRRAEQGLAPDAQEDARG